MTLTPPPRSPIPPKNCTMKNGIKEFHQVWPLRAICMRIHHHPDDPHHPVLRAADLHCSATLGLADGLDDPRTRAPGDRPLPGRCLGAFIPWWKPPCCVRPPPAPASTTPSTCCSVFALMFVVQSTCATRKIQRSAKHLEIGFWMILFVLNALFYPTTTIVSFDRTWPTLRPCRAPGPVEDPGLLSRFQPSAVGSCHGRPAFRAIRRPSANPVEHQSTGPRRT